MYKDRKYLAMALQEALLALTRQNVIHWGKYEQGPSLEDFEKQLQGEAVEEKSRPCYSVDLRLILGYMEDMELQEPASDDPNQLKNPAVTGHSLQLTIEQLDEEGQQGTGYEITLNIPLELAAEAERSQREYEKLLRMFGGSTSSAQ